MNNKSKNNEVKTQIRNQNYFDVLFRFIIINLSIHKSLYFVIRNKFLFFFISTHVPDLPSMRKTIIR